jgi:polyisoprenyl-teichoic acid--peptidoglycan teichoic acid transferase
MSMMGNPAKGRRRIRRALVTGLVTALAAGGAAVGVHLAGVSSAEAADLVEIHSVHGASFVPALEGQRPLFILVLGSDARPGQAIAGQRTDSIHLIGIDPAHDRATILGFPRDSWVPIPGHGVNKINTAMTFGGPALTVRTVENLTGIRIDFWALTSFNGLVNMVNGIGGLTVFIPQALHDRFSGAFFSRGVHRLRGAQALAFARDRHDFLSGDISRSKNQGTIMVAALDRLHAVFAKRPSELLAWIALGWRNIHTDLSPQVLLQLALTATQVPVKKVNNLVVPSSTGTVGAQSVVFIQPSARRLYADMRADGIIGH